MGANELSALLWQERELLDLLIFKLEEEQLLLTAGKSRWLQHATREVEQVVTRLRAAGLARLMEAGMVAREWGVPSPEPSLNELANAAPDGPWGEILRAHLEAMSSQTAQIKQLRDANEQFLRAAAISTQETVSSLRPDAGTYDAHGASGGATGAAGPHAQLFDTQL
ncbi:flagellar export chaperone FlgN [Paenarthrobacter sp. DKR-5]|uniref:flagellar protein FlgN n=1 Tax=Paenarthrobacter sp. DKR-5 TaxID=2835535 RepID=UPI001BDD5B8C|nr:flagellar protein FlgN [Paenarthrobacter sp. DKR-5]MBT1004463.1 flagellar export chaperone FlgN [Paenarthrobacter sp. DKR-5]